MVALRAPGAWSTAGIDALLEGRPMSRLIAGRPVLAAGLRSPGSRAPSHREPTAPDKADFSLAPILRIGLERKAGTPDLLAEIARPRAAGANR